MVHLSMGCDSMVADDLSMKRDCLVLEDFLSFSLCVISCIAKEQMTLNKLRLLSCLDSWI